MKATVTIDDIQVEIELTEQQVECAKAATRFVEGRPKNLNQALEYLGEETREEFDKRTQFDRPHELAAKSLEVIIRAINKKRKPVYDGSEKHYFPVFNRNAAFGFASTYYGLWSTYTNVGERLEFFCEEDVKFAVTQFLPLYKLMLT